MCPTENLQKRPAARPGRPAAGLIFSQVVERELDEVFHALADPTRRSIVRRLSPGEATVTELAAPYDISLGAGSAR
jgi:hypothetical protein